MHRSGRGRGGGAGQGHDLLDRQAQLQQVQRVADADLTLDLHVQQGRHDDRRSSRWLTSSHVPGWHPDSELGRETGGKRLCMAVEGLTHGAQDGGAGAGGGGGAHTHLQPDHNSWPVPLCEGTPCLQASSSNSCLQVTKHSKFKNHYYTRV